MPLLMVLPRLMGINATCLQPSLCQFLPHLIKLVPIKSLGLADDVQLKMIGVAVSV